MKRSFYLLLLLVFILSCQKDNLNMDMEHKPTIQSDNNPYLPATVPDKESKFLRDMKKNMLKEKRNLNGIWQMIICFGVLLKRVKNH